MSQGQDQTFEYRWISGIRDHMHVITGGVDMHVAFDDWRVVPESIDVPDPTNGFRGTVLTTQELPTRVAVYGLYAVSQMTPFDEFLVVDAEGRYRGHLNRGRDGLYAAFPLGIRVDPRNQRFQSIPEALKYIARELNG